MAESGGIPTWAKVAGAGVAAWLWAQQQFPTRGEEILRHQALDARLEKLTDVVDKHVGTEGHPAEMRRIGEHEIRILALEEGQKRIAEKLDQNAELLRQVRDRLPEKPGR